MGALEESAIRRLTAAVKDKPLGTGALAEVGIDDVAIVAGLVKEHTGMSAAIRDGAAAAAGHNGHGALGVKVWQEADKLRHLLELVGT